MSFMFNPYPYDDPNAFNVLDFGPAVVRACRGQRGGLRRRKRQKPPGP